MMYQAFYGMQQSPFTLLPDPDYFFSGGSYEGALAYLEYGLLSHKGFIVLTGEPGLGKTTLLRKIIREKKGEVTVGEILNTNAMWSSVVPWVALAFQLKTSPSSSQNHYQELVQFLQESSLHRKHPALLIVDEAQNLTVPMLEELRLLSNVNVDNLPTLQIILAGQPQLRTLLQQPDLIQFAQRIEVDCSLQALDREMTVEYIHHRLHCVAVPLNLFTGGACGLIHDLTRGIPRLINQVCDLSLTYGFAKQMPRISDQIVAEAALDRLPGGILPLDHTVQLQAIVARETLDPGLLSQAGTGKERIGVVASVPVPVEKNGKPDQADLTPEKQRSLPEIDDPREMSHSLHPSLLVKDQDEARKILEQGILLHKKRKYRLAIKVLMVAAQHAPTRIQAHREIGACLISAGKPQKAISYFQQSLKSASSVVPEDDEAVLLLRYELGKALWNTGQHTQGIEQFHSIATIRPDFYDIQTYLKNGSSRNHHAEQVEETTRIRNSLWSRLLNRLSFSRLSK